MRVPGFFLVRRLVEAMVLLAVSSLTAAAPKPTPDSAVDPLAWPQLQREAKPWAYWWWLGSAVDPANLTRELQRYRDAGMGGVHIIPIYGAKGFEDKFIDYLSPRWMEMLRHTVTEARRLDLGVDMTTGTGWCFGGPQVTDLEANALVVAKTFEVAAGEQCQERFDRNTTQALVAFSGDDKCLELTDRITPEGALAWSPPSGTWRVYAISQRPSGQKVKRAAPGGQGHMLNLIYPEAVRHYLQRFEEAFSAYDGPKPRAMYHDSYEYRSDWAPDFFAAFEKRRGYRLQTELPALFGKAETNRAARVRCDYRETASDVMIEDSLPLWSDWCRRHGFLTRNEAHGSPGNWLDLYALADIPETEMFNKDRNKLISKFASAAAHVSGKNLVACETGTWLKEHFTETLADMKYLLDDLFLSGVNQVIYHGTCYSPDEAGWPGWLFYASYEMNPRNSVWRDVPALNAYAGRSQALLQSGRPDNDILLYWPLHDFWHNTGGTIRNLTVHARDWFEGQPVGKTAELLWNRGHAFDYVSDRQVVSAKARKGGVEVPGGTYQAVVVPPTEHLPLDTFRAMLDLAKAGATIIFADHLPADVPGWGKLEERRAQFKNLVATLKFRPLAQAGLREAKSGKGRVLVGDLEAALAVAGVARETLFDQPGLMCIRRAFDGGRCYFIANRSEQNTIQSWVPLAFRAQSAVVLDPLTGHAGLGRLRTRGPDGTEVFLHLAAGESVFLRCFRDHKVNAPAWPVHESAGAASELQGSWQVSFIQGGPELPAPLQTPRLASWTQLGDTNAQAFAGTARYTLQFDAPSRHNGPWFLDLGRVCQSARVRLNGRDYGSLITPPFRIVVSLQAGRNLLEVEVTNVAANRIRDLDRRDVPWKNFHDINFVNLNYKPFDASEWPLADSGLLGPVTLEPARPVPMTSAPDR